MSCRQALWPSAQASQPLPRPLAPVDQQVAPFGDPVAGGELQEQRAVEPAWALIVHVFDAGRMPQTSGSCARLEALLATQRQLVFEQQTEPFGVLEAASLVLMFKFSEPLGDAIEAKRVQLIVTGATSPPREVFLPERHCLCDLGRRECVDGSIHATSQA